MLIALRSAKCFGLAIGQHSDRNERSLLSLVIVFPNFLQRNCLFREEIDTDIVWAGRFDPDERQQRVRTSFEAWRELKLGQAREWTKEELEIVQALSTHLTMAVMSNAFKFTTQGEIRVSAVPHDSSNFAKISVTDTGIGIDSAQQERLFEPFVQADGSVKRRYGGTGLGLTVCKRLVELMGGEIWLHSVGYGQGTTVSFTLGRSP